MDLEYEQSPHRQNQSELRNPHPPKPNNRYPVKKTGGRRHRILALSVHDTSHRFYFEFHRALLEARGFSEPSLPPKCP